MGCTPERCEAAGARTCQLQLASSVRGRHVTSRLGRRRPTAGLAPIRASQRGRQAEVVRGRHLGAEATQVANADNSELTRP